MTDFKERSRVAYNAISEEKITVELVCVFKESTQLLWIGEGKQDGEIIDFRETGANAIITLQEEEQFRDSFNNYRINRYRSDGHQTFWTCRF